MSLLRINNSTVDIDDKTAIGISFQAYDIKEPGKRKVTVSNSFTIPKTANNMAIIGFAGNNQFNGTDVYDAMYCDYWIGNEKVIDNARVRIEGVQDRISLFVFQKKDVWDEMKLLSWPDFVTEFITWLQDEEGYPSSSSPYIGSLATFLAQYNTATEGLFLPFYLGNLYDYEPGGEGTGYLEDTSTIWLKYWPDTETLPANGGHFCAFMKTIFEFIEYKYDVDFLTAGGTTDYNLWDDAVALKAFVPIRDIDVVFNYSGPTVNGFYFEPVTQGSYKPEDDIEDKPDKTLYDCVNAFFQHINVIKDDILVNGSPAIALHRFDDIENLTTNKFTGRIQGTPKFIPYIPGFVQENIIKFSSIFENGNPLTNARTINCDNKNINASQTLFEIDSHICNFVDIGGGAVVPNLSTPESFETFEFFVEDGNAGSITVNISDNTASAETAVLTLKKAALYSLASEYTFMDDIVQYPKFWEIEKWLTLNDIKSIEFFKQYYIQELNCSVFINKISGFNPKKSYSPTKMEVIKISDQVAIDLIDLEYFYDGVGVDFTDGNGDEFF